MYHNLFHLYLKTNFFLPLETCRQEFIRNHHLSKREKIYKNNLPFVYSGIRNRRRIIYGATHGAGALAAEEQYGDE